MKMPGSGLGFRVSGLSKPDYLNPKALLGKNLRFWIWLFCACLEADDVILNPKPYFLELLGCH